MAIQQTRVGSLQNVLEGAHDQWFPRPAKDRMAKLCREIDKIGRVHSRSGGPHISEKDLRKLLKDVDSELVSDRLTVEIKQISTGQLVEDTPVSPMTSALWFELAGRVRELEPSPAATLAELSLPSRPTRREFDAALIAYFPSVPREFFEHDTLRGRIEQLIEELRQPSVPAHHGSAQGLASVSAVFQCLVANLGFWAALSLALVVAVAIVCISLSAPAGGPLTVAAAWNLFYWLTGVSLGAWTLTVLGNCILDPIWRA